MFHSKNGSIAWKKGLSQGIGMGMQYSLVSMKLKRFSKYLWIKLKLDSKILPNDCKTLKKQKISSLGESYLWTLYSRMLWRGQQLKTIDLLVFFLSGLFLTVDLLTVVSDRIARAFVFLGLLELQHLTCGIL